MSIDRGMDKDVVHVYNGILPSRKKNEIMPFAATWMDLKSVILSQTEREKYCMESLICGNATNGLKNRKRPTDLENELMVASREGIRREIGKVIYTLLYSK